MGRGTMARQARRISEPHQGPVDRPVESNPRAAPGRAQEGHCRAPPSLVFFAAGSLMDGNWGLSWPSPSVSLRGPEKLPDAQGTWKKQHWTRLAMVSAALEGLGFSDGDRLQEGRRR